MIEAIKDKTIAIVDVETTGASSTHDRIIEIGILRIENGAIVKTYNRLINPETSVSPFITGITGITAEEIADCPTFEDLKDEIFELLDGAIFMAHNARFDYGFIKNEFKRTGLTFNADCLCTVRLSRKMYSQYKRHDLSTIISRFGFSCENRHRAFDDAKILWNFISHIEQSGKSSELIKAVNELLKKPTYPQLLDEKIMSTIPYGPGVYIFYGPADEMLYIGKSRNMRQRVLSHFSNDINSTKEMHLCQQTKRIEAIKTAGELGALLLESRMIKDCSPLYNRQLRRTSYLVAARKQKVDGYFSVSLDRLKSIDAENYQDIVGIFKNIAQGKKFLTDITDEYGLCPKILGLEKTGGPCFNIQLKKCTGACIGKADKNEFNSNFNKAFARRRIKSWPYAGPIIIEEKENDWTHSFVIDNWCLVAEYQSSNEQYISKPSPAFDYDSYKIFVRFLKDAANRKKIRLLEKSEVEQLGAPVDDYAITIE